MKTASELLMEYQESHRHPTNRLIHKLCVPAIFWSVIGMLWALPIDKHMAAFGGAALVLTFYAFLGATYFLAMLTFTLVCFVIVFFMERMLWPVGYVALGVFIIAWIGQFLGHRIEGKHPSFFEDIVYLFIGPLWIMFRRD